MATYAIGDIQGCYGTFVRLLEVCGFRADLDRLWLVGDLVNRGPGSLEVLRHVRALGNSATVVLGNHDLYLLMVAQGGMKRRQGDDTLDEVLAAPDRDELLNWLRHQPLMHLEGGHAMVHAGLLPQWTATEARRLAAEVESALQADNYRDFLANMWGSEPAAWDEGLTGWPRLRVIVNAMTRMRFCTPEGVMEFKAKGELHQAPSGYIPWFEVAGRQSADVTLVTGHWSALGLRLEPNFLALDSGCLWGGKLSALRLEDRALFQVDCLSEESVPLVKE